MKRYVANKADQQGIFRGDRKEEIGKYKIKFDSVQAKNFKNCNPLGIQKKSIEFIFIINIIIKISSEALI